MQTPTYTDAQIDEATAYYRQHWGPITRDEIVAAASPRRNYYTLAELLSLRHAGIATRAD